MPFAVSRGGTARLAGVLVCCAVMLPAALSAAAPQTQAAVPPDAGEVVVNLDERIIGLPVARGALASAQLEVASARSDSIRLLEQIASLETARARLNDRIGALQEMQRRATEDQQEWKLAAEDAIAATYMYRNASDTGGVSPVAELDRQGAERGFALVSDNATKRYLSAVDRFEDAVEEEARRRAEVAALDTRRAEADAEAVKLGTRLERAQAKARRAVASAVIADLDIPLVTLDAYLRAERSAAEQQPQCRLPWWALAGIGRVETNHGRFGGAFPNAAGRVNPAIIGMALDGTGNGGNLVPIVPPDGGALHGDPNFDHAVGPMQFITSTWLALGSDGNGDRVRDPQNVYDATLAATKLLCKGAPASGLTTDSALRSAFKRYNNSDEYSADVLEWGREYEATGLTPVADPESETGADTVP